ncbi:MAG: hypothetical protein K8S98_05035 [Planctomycetes bacterium]|nr:hypothetical protein [Planctomycetota bacterium]
MQRNNLYDSHGWLLAAGAVLAAIGLWRQPVQGTGGGTTPPLPQDEQTFPAIAMAATADSNNRMIAVTGTDITGASILYVIDTVSYQLAVYQAVGGSESSQGLKLVGARRIDLDFKVDGYKDRSQFPYKKLRDEFQKQGLLSGSAPKSGATVPGDPANQ